jgi:hypothetical protein
MVSNAGIVSDACLDDYLADFDIDILLNTFIKDLSDRDIIDLLDMSKNIYSSIESHEKKLKDINIKGYVNDTDLSNYSLINEVIQHIIKNNKPTSSEAVMGCDIKGRVIIGGRGFSYATAKDLFK